MTHRSASRCVFATHPTCYLIDEYLTGGEHSQSHQGMLGRQPLWISRAQKVSQYVKASA